MTERLKAGGEGDGRGWDGWMASPTRWTWVWTSSGSWWWTGKPGMLQSMGLQRVGHNWVTELNWTEWLMMSSIFSCACWPFVNLLRNIYSKYFGLFSLGCLSFCCWVWVLYIFWIQGSSQIYNLQTVSPFFVGSFTFLIIFLKAKMF